MNLIGQLNSLSLEPSFQSRIIRFLENICSIDTAPCSDLTGLAERENKIFQYIIEELDALSFQKARVVKRKVSPQIQTHPAYSRPFYTESERNPEGLSADEVYRDRYNLLYLIEHSASGAGRSTALNAHIDTVAPYFPPRRDRDYLYGRGTADDKGNVAVLIGALSALDYLSNRRSLTLKNNITAMFVIDEEIGGNGSLDLVLDQKLVGGFASILVLECTGNKIHPANRGAVYFRCEANLKNTPGVLEGRSSLLEAFIWAVLELEREGDMIREESNHPMFPHKPVQTCFGILGPFGKHPSSICGQVGFVLKGLDEKKARDAVQLALNKGLTRYINKYGDKTTETDPSTGRKKVEKHFEIQNQEAGVITIVVYGSTGHMGSLQQNDAAITKWAYMAEKLLQEKLKGALSFSMELLGSQPGDTPFLEGAQGFLPTHPIGEIQQRMTGAFRRGMERYLKLTGLTSDDLYYAIGFKKLHNNAYASDPRSPSMLNARKAGAMAATVGDADPVRGWDVSCDARLFANEYPEMPVITAGAGKLEYAHSDEERIYLPDLFRSIVFAALFLLFETGSVS